MRLVGFIIRIYHDARSPERQKIIIILLIITLLLTEEGYLRIYRIRSRGQPTRGKPPAWSSCEVLATPHRENLPYCRGLGLILWYEVHSGQGTSEERHIL